MPSVCVYCDNTDPMVASGLTWRSITQHTCGNRAGPARKHVLQVAVSLEMLQVRDAYNASRLALRLALTPFGSTVVLSTVRFFRAGTA